MSYRPSRREAIIAGLAALTTPALASFSGPRLAALAEGVGVPSWVPLGSDGKPAKFFRDAGNGRYWFNGVSYASEAAFLTAAGGVISSSARVFGPYVDPTNTNLLVNANFATDVSSWVASGTGASISWNNPGLLFTSGGSLNSFAQAVSGTLGRAFQFSLGGHRGTTGNSLFPSSGINAAVNGTIGAAAYGSTTIEETHAIIASSVADTTYFGVRNSSGAGTGTFIATSSALLEGWPFKGWTANNIVATVAATAPASHSVDQVVWQSDAQNERDRIRLIRQASDTHLHLIVTSNNLAQADLDMGAVADSAAFTLAFACGQNSFTASLGGGVPVTDLSGVCPGAAIMQIGRSFTGNAWTGSDPVVAVF